MGKYAWWMSSMQGGKGKSPRRSALLGNRVCCYWDTEQQFWCSFIPAWQVLSMMSATVQNTEAASISSESRVAGAREHRKHKQLLLSSELGFKAEAWIVHVPQEGQGSTVLFVNQSCSTGSSTSLVSTGNVCVTKQHPCPPKTENLMYNPDF